MLVELLKIKLLMLLSCQAGKSWIIKQQRRAKSLNKQEQLAEGNIGRSILGGQLEPRFNSVWFLLVRHFEGLADDP